MRGLRQVRVSAIIFLLTGACTGCMGSGELSREEAARLIKPRADEQKETRNVGLTFFVDCGIAEEQRAGFSRILKDELGKRDRDLLRLVDAGLVTPGSPNYMYPSPSPGSVCPGGSGSPTQPLYKAVVEYSFSPSAKQDVVREFSEEDRISRENPNRRGFYESVPFTIRRAEIILSRDSFVGVTGIRPDSKIAAVEYQFKREATPFGVAYGRKSEARGASAHFQKYDDGWRMLPGLLQF